MKIFFVKITAFILLALVFVLPTMTLAANAYTPLILCGNHPSIDNAGKLAGSCSFGDFIDTINRIINWIISIAGVIFTVSCIWGGFLYLTSGDKPANRDKAKDILWNTLKGFVIILISWLIVYTLLNTIIPNDGTSVYRGSIFKFIGTGN